MKITFVHEGGVHEFTPPDFATSVVIKARANGVTLDYESSTVEAVKEFFEDRPVVHQRPGPSLQLKPPVKQPAPHRGKKGVGWKLTPADKDRIVKEWVEKKTSYDTLAARYGIHGSTVCDIIHQAMRNPVTIRPAKKKAIKQTKTWDRRPLADDVKKQVVELNAAGKMKTEIADELGISTNSVKRILKGVHHPGRNKKLSLFQEDEIIRLIDEGAIARQAIADKFKVNITTVNRVLAKKRKENFTKEMLDTTTG